MLASVRLICAAAAVAAAAPALAAPYMAETANWTVFSLTNNCIAENRPPAEYNFSPWNSLTLRAPKSGGIQLAAMFWPDVLEDDADYKLIVATDGGATHELDAHMGAGTGLETREPLPEDVLAELTAVQLVTVHASGVEVQLEFDTTHLSDVLKLLETCRAGLGS